MGETASRQSTIAQSALVAALTLAAFTALCGVLAYWTWTWFGPKPAPRLEAPPAQQSRVEAAYTLFGGQRSAAPAPTALAIKLLGVVASSAAGTGYAVIQVEANKTLASTLDKVTKNAPAGSDVAVAAMKSALAAANSAYDSVTKAVKQVTEMAEANAEALTSAATKASPLGQPSPR